MVASALLGHWLSYTGCWQSLLVMYWLMFGMLFLFLTTSLGCFVHGLCFSINGLTKLPWTSYLQAMLRIISRSVSDWAGWRLGPWMNTCLLCMIVHFSANILKWELVCKFGVRFHIFINIYAFTYIFTLFYGLTLIPTWMSNRMPSKLWDEITYPFLNFNGCTVDVKEWISKFSPRFII